MANGNFHAAATIRTSVEQRRRIESVFAKVDGVRDSRGLSVRPSTAEIVTVALRLFDSLAGHSPEKAMAALADYRLGTDIE